jgi:hypothetical protein
VSGMYICVEAEPNIIICLSPNTRTQAYLYHAVFLSCNENDFFLRPLCLGSKYTHLVRIKISQGIIWDASATHLEVNCERYWVTVD